LAVQPSLSRTRPDAEHDRLPKLPNRMLLHDRLKRGGGGRCLV